MTEKNDILKVTSIVRLLRYMNIIMAVDENFGYSKNGEIPWKNNDDLQHFKQMTENNIVIMGRKTWESLPVKPLPRRINIVITKTQNDDDRCFRFKSLTTAIEMCLNFPKKEIFIIGGAQLVGEALKHPNFSKLFLTIVNGNYNCDQFLSLPLSRFSLENEKQITNATISQYSGKFFNKGESEYLKLGKTILNDGHLRETRNGKTLSLFGKKLELDIREGFPLLTTKKMFFRGIVEELLFFISGKTDTKILENKGINIWKGNTCKEFLKDKGLDYQPGDMGPMYGFQWRYFNAEYKGSNDTYTGKGLDQLANIIYELKTNPTSRRLLMTAYNPLQADKGVLYPCHSIVIQFYVNDGNLSCKMYQRSADYFLGLPFNIASTALLLEIIAKECELKPEKIIITMGDIHIYEEHIRPVKEQVERLPYTFPQLKIKKEQIYNYVFEDFELIGYNCYDTLKAIFKP